MNVIHITEWMLWIFMAPSVLYVAFYALVSLFPSRTAKHQPSTLSHQPSSFLILFPAYKEDSVIVHSVRQCLEQTYPKDFYHIGVISDHMQDDTNELLRQLPITLFTPQFEKSSKAKAMQYAIKEINGQWSTVNGKFDYVIILAASKAIGQFNATAAQRTAITTSQYWMELVRRLTTPSSVKHITLLVFLLPSLALVCVLNMNGSRTMLVYLKQPLKIARWKFN